MTPFDDAATAEVALRDVFRQLTDPHEGECVLCYVYRMLEFGCLPDRLTWAKRWRDLRAPRATGLERRLEARGGFCDCEIFLNGWQQAQPQLDEHGDPLDQGPMPPCRGVRRGSARPCSLWVPKSQGLFAP